MTRKQRKITLIAVALLVLMGAGGLVLYALSAKITYFSSPTDLISKRPEPTKRLRLGGLVENGSLVRGQGSDVSFSVTDGNATVKVAYRGILPDLFREGQGVVTEGTLDPSGLFKADAVLAKHDENYVPKEVVDSLKAQGHWHEGQGASPAAAQPGGASQNQPGGASQNSKKL